MDYSCAHHIGIPIFDKRFVDIGKPQDVTMTTDFGSHLKQARKLAGLTQMGAEVLDIQQAWGLFAP